MITVKVLYTEQIKAAVIILAFVKQTQACTIVHRPSCNMQLYRGNY